MNRKIKSVIALLLTAVMALSLTACGSKDESGTPDPAASAASEYAYVSEFAPVGDGTFRSTMDVGLFADDCFYATAMVKVGENIPEGVVPEFEDQYAVYETVLYRCGYDGSMEQLENYTPVDPGQREHSEERDYRMDTYINKMCSTPDGKLLIFYNGNEYWNTAPESVASGTDAYWEQGHYDSSYWIRTVGADGGELTCAVLQIPEEISSPTDGSWFYPMGVAVGTDGSFILGSSSNVLTFDMDGKMTSCINMGELWAESLIRLNDGRIAVSAYGNEGMELHTVDTEKGKLGDKMPLPVNAYTLMPGGGDYDFYFTNGLNFCGYKMDTQETVTLFNWLNCDVNPDNVYTVGILDDGTVVSVTNDWDKNYENCTTELVKITKVPAASVPHKETLTLATQGLNWAVRDMIIDFNKSSDSLRIEVNDYSQYNTQEDYSLGLTKLNTELMAGSVPDILDMSGISADKLATKGLLEDLYPYLDADPEFSRDGFFQNVLKAAEYNGALVCTCSTFDLETAIGPTAVVGDKPGWTYAQLFEALDSMPEGCSVFGFGYDRYSVLRTGISADLNTYCNWGTGECSFDSEGFKDLLRFAAKFPAEVDWNDYEAMQNDTWTNIAEGRQLLLQTGIYAPSDTALYDALFGEQGATYIGFPSADGNGNMMRLNAGYAMTTKCRDKEGAWEFLRCFFQEKYQLDQYSIPTNINAYNKLLKDAMTPTYRRNENGDIMLDENGEKIREPLYTVGTANGKSIDVYELSQEQADKLWELVTTTTKTYNEDTEMYNLILEQVEGFFQGQKSVDDVTRIIQNKATIYINEQR